MGDVEKLRGGVAGCGKGIAEHGVAEGAGGAEVVAPVRQFFGADVADALAGFFAEEGEAAAGAAAEAALVVAGGFDECACEGTMVRGSS